MTSTSASRRVLGVVGLLVLLLTVWVAFLELTGPQLDESPEHVARLEDAKAIGAALLAYADQHEHRLPPSLEALKPTYLGTNVDVSPFTLHYPSGVLEAPRDGRVIAAELLRDRSAPFICIYGTGEADFLIPGE